MTTLAIIGANGQVGSEVCLYLSQSGAVRVVPICRTLYGSAFLRRCGLECRIGSLSDAAGAASLLSGCDLVADFSNPQGSRKQVRDAIRATLKNAILYAPSQARFVYISSIMAFGMGLEDRVIKPYLLAHSAYGADKRFGEHLASRMARRARRELYVLRLGQVHGELQACSRSLKAQLRAEPAHIPEGFSYTVFAFSIAESLLHIAMKKERPGTYTLVSHPEWTWEELYDFYCRRAGITPTIVPIPSPVHSSGAVALLARPYHALAGACTRFIERNRGLIGGYLTGFLPGIENRFNAARYERIARREIEEGKARCRYQPFPSSWRGRTPGIRLRSLSDTRLHMDKLSVGIRPLS